MSCSVDLFTDVTRAISRQLRKRGRELYIGEKTGALINDLVDVLGRIEQAAEPVNEKPQPKDGSRIVPLVRGEPEPLEPAARQPGADAELVRQLRYHARAHECGTHSPRFVTLLKEAASRIEALSAPAGPGSEGGEVER